MVIKLFFFFEAFVLGLIFNAVPGVVFAETIKRGVSGGFWGALYVQIGSLVGDATWAILGLIGIIAGLWSEKFDHMASVTNFIIIPLSFLSGTFYTIDNLPEFLQVISKCNPFFYMIDGFRYGFLEEADGSIFVGAIYLTALAIILWFVTYLLYKKVYKVKS